MSDAFASPSKLFEHHDNGMCLRSLFIYCPSLSSGKEDGVMDNILYFYPAHLHPNTQMNRVGFCIGVSCMVGRFRAPTTDVTATPISPPLPSCSSCETVDEIRMMHATIVLFCPFADLWIAAEVAAAYDSSAVMPVLRKGFEAFVLRYGWPTVEALVKPLDGVLDDTIRARAALNNFYEKFALFLETRVLLVGIQHVVQATAGMATHLPAPSSTSDGGINSRRWRRRWKTVASAESLLGFPVFIRTSTRAVRLMCHSLVYRHLSLLLRSNLEENGGGGSRKKNLVRGWGHEHLGVPMTPDGTTLVKMAEEQLLWTRLQYVVLIEESLKVVVSNISEEIVSQLTLLMLMEPEMARFNVFVRGGEQWHCHIYHMSGVIFAILIDEVLYRLVEEFLHATCRALTDDIVEFLTRGAQTLTRETHHLARPAGMQQQSPSLLKPPFDTAAAFFAQPSIPEFPKTNNTKITLQWTVWHDGMLAGSPMREYPRSVHVTMSAMMRTLIRGTHDKTDGCRCGGDHSDMRYAVTWGLGKIETPHLCVDVPKTATEVWAPLRGATWVCVIQRDHRVGGMVFYNAAPLQNCFDCVAELHRKMLLFL